MKLWLSTEVLEEITFENIKEYHPRGLEGIISSYRWTDVKKSIPFQISVLTSIVFCVLILFSKKTMYDILIYWNGQILSIFPNLLGFNLGGYALIIGFGNTQLVKAITKKGEKKNTSVFQKLSGIFAFTLLLQAFTFTISFLINAFVQLDFPVINNSVSIFINTVLLICISFLGMWGLTIIISLVKNIFTFGQMHHFYLTLERLKEVNNDSSTTKKEK